MTVSTENIKYIQQPSQGVVELVNKVPKDYSFIKDTRFVTDDGRQFIAVKNFTLLQ